MGYSTRSNTYTITVQNVAFSPADATTYYVGGPVVAPSNGVSNIRIVKLPITGTLIGANISFTVNTSFGTAETSTLYARLNNTTDVTLSTAIKNNAIYNEINMALNQSVTIGDTFEIKWITPTWVTNPVGVQMFIQLIFSY